MPNPVGGIPVRNYVIGTERQSVPRHITDIYGQYIHYILVFKPDGSGDTGVGQFGRPDALFTVESSGGDSYGFEYARSDYEPTNAIVSNAKGRNAASTFKIVCAKQRIEDATGRKEKRFFLTKYVVESYLTPTFAQNLNKAKTGTFTGKFYETPSFYGSWDTHGILKIYLYFGEEIVDVPILPEFSVNKFILITWDGGGTPLNAKSENVRTVYFDNDNPSFGKNSEEMHEVLRVVLKAIIPFFPSNKIISIKGFRQIQQPGYGGTMLVSSVFIELASDVAEVIVKIKGATKRVGEFDFVKIKFPPYTGMDTNAFLSRAEHALSLRVSKNSKSKKTVIKDFSNQYISSLNPSYLAYSPDQTETTTEGRTLFSLLKYGLIDNSDTYPLIVFEGSGIPPNLVLIEVGVGVMEGAPTLDVVFCDGKNGEVITESERNMILQSIYPASSESDVSTFSLNGTTTYERKTTTTNFHSGNLEYASFSFDEMTQYVVIKTTTYSSINGDINFLGVAAFFGTLTFKSLGYIDTLIGKYIGWDFYTGSNGYSAKYSGAMPNSEYGNPILIEKEESGVKNLYYLFNHLPKGKLYFYPQSNPARVVVSKKDLTFFRVFTELHSRATGQRIRRSGGTIKRTGSSAEPYMRATTGDFSYANEGALLTPGAVNVSYAPTDFGINVSCYEYLAYYEPGVTITFQATPAAGNAFAAWELPIDGDTEQARGGYKGTGVTSPTITIPVVDEDKLMTKLVEPSMAGAKEISAVFITPDPFNVAIYPAGKGKITVQEKRSGAVPASYSANSSVSSLADNIILNAVPIENWMFVRWEMSYLQRALPKGSTAWTANTQTTVVEQMGTNSTLEIPTPFYDWDGAGKKTYTITAYFEEAPKTTLILALSGSGSVGFPGVSYSTPDTPSGTYGFYVGQTTSISATAAEHWSFNRWDGDLTTTESPSVLTLNMPKKVTGIFYPDPKLTVEIEGTGRVGSSDNLINCTAGQSNLTGDSEEQYVSGHTVTLTAQTVGMPFSFYNEWYFARWEDAAENNTTPSATLTITENTKATAVFKRYPTLVIRVIEGDGAIVGNPPDLSGGEFKSPYNGQGDMKIARASGLINGCEPLLALPNPGWKLKKWTGDVYDFRETINVPMADGVDKTVYAHFVEIVNLALNVSPATVGVLYDSGWNYESTDTFSVILEKGLSMQLIALETNFEYVFSHWQSSPATYSGETDNPLSIAAINTDLTLTAVFDRIQYSVHVRVTPAGCGGRITGNGFDTDTSDILNFYINTEITLTASLDDPENGYLFYFWNEDYQTSDNPLTFILSGNVEIEAVFYKPTDWLVKRLSPPKRANQGWIEFARTNERFWENGFDSALNRLRNMSSFFTADLRAKERFIQEYQNYYKADFPPENLEIFVSDRRNLIALKGQQAFYEEILDNIDSNVTTAFVPLFAKADEPYGSKFYVEGEDFTPGDSGYYRTSRGFLTVNGFPLSPTSQDKWSETFRKIKPIETVLDGGRGIPFYTLEYESELDFDVCNIYQLNTGSPIVIPVSPIISGALYSDFHRGEKIYYFVLDYENSPPSGTIRVKVTANSLNATLFGKWSTQTLPTETYYDLKSSGLSGQSSFELILPSASELGMGTFFIGLKADRAKLTEETGLYPGNRGYYCNGGCTVSVVVG